MSQTNMDLSGSQHHVVLLNGLQACYGAVWLVVIHHVPELIKLGDRAASLGLTDLSLLVHSV